MERFSSRCRAHIQYVISFFDSCLFRYHDRSCILYLEFSFPERRDCCQIIIAWDQKRRRKKRMFFYLNAFSCQLSDQLFFGGCISIDPDCCCTFFIKTFQDVFRLLFSIISHPHTDDPLWHGILYWEKFFCILRIRNLINVSRDISKYPIYKSPQVLKAFPGSKVDCFIACCRIRNLIHVFDLIDRTAQDIADHRFHFFCLYFWKLVDNIVQFYPPLCCPFCKPGQKCTVLLGQILIFFQHLSEHDMTFLSTLDFQQDYQCKFSCTYSLVIRRHFFFLLSGSVFLKAAEVQMLHSPHR